MHDPLAVASAFAPEILTTSAARVRVHTDGEDRGRSSLDDARGDSPVDVAFDLDEESFRSILERRFLSPTFGR
jgi:inosine-uridine nucleoside N-ribohydrolase